MKEIEKLPEAKRLLDLPISYEEKGKEIGKQEGVKQVALELLREGLDVELIVKVTSLEMDEIEKLKKQL